MSERELEEFLILVFGYQDSAWYLPRGFFCKKGMSAKALAEELRDGLVREGIRVALTKRERVTVLFIYTDRADGLPVYSVSVHPVSQLVAFNDVGELVSVMCPKTPQELQSAS